MNYLDIPANRMAATAAGCDLVGNNNGSGLAGLISLAGGAGLAEFVNPDDMGEISLVLLGQLDGWAAGTTANTAGSATLNLFNGVQGDAGDFWIDPDSFVDGNALVSFPDSSIENSCLAAGPGTFSVSLPIIPDLPIELSIIQTEITGALAVDGPGWSLESGVLGGYLTRQAILDLIRGLQIACAADDPPSLCDQAGAILGGPDDPPENALPILEQFIGGFDSKVEGETASACDPGVPMDCNAVSVCLLVGIGGIEIAGVADAE